MEPFHSFVKFGGISLSSLPGFVPSYSSCPNESFRGSLPTELMCELCGQRFRITRKRPLQRSSEFPFISIHEAIGKLPEPHIGGMVRNDGEFPHRQRFCGRCTKNFGDRRIDENFVALDRSMIHSTRKGRWYWPPSEFVSTRRQIKLDRFQRRT